MRPEAVVNAGGGGPHSAHLLEAAAFMVISLGVIALVDHRKTRGPQPRRTTMRWPDPLVLAMVLAGMTAANIHFAVAPGHWSEDPLYGFFFLVAATAQMTGCLLILWRPRRALLTANALGNASLVLLWLVTRTVGIPLGAQRGEIESLGVLDVLATGAECASVLCGVLLLRGAVAASRLPSRRQVPLMHPGNGG